MDHQTRLLRQYLLVTTALRAVAVLVGLFPGTTAVSGSVPRALATVGLGLAGLVLLQRRPQGPSVHLAATVLAIAAIPVALSSHREPAALVVCTVAAMFLAMYVAAFHPPREAATLVALLVALAGVGFALSPAAVQPFGYVVLLGSIVAAALSYGALTRALLASATTDPLTGLLNRAGLELAIARALAGLGGRSAPMTLAVLDVDNFKTINDTQGHLAGDVLLSTLAQHWRDHLPRHAIVARTGGDEIAVVLVGHTGDHTRELVEAAALRCPTPTSYGLATASTSGLELSALYRAADLRLYEAKRARVKDRDLNHLNDLNPAISPDASRDGDLATD